MSCPWLHCNICLRLPSSSSRYFISNCGHVACHRCVENNLITPNCKICGKSTKLEEINNKLNPELRKYFLNLHDHTKKAFDEIKAVLDFQSKNCRRLMKHKMEKIQELQNMTMKQSEDLVMIEKLQEQVKELKARNIALETENQSLNASFRQQQTVVNHFLTGNATAMNHTAPLFAENAAAMNTTPSFLNNQSRETSLCTNTSQADMFNLMNASYLSRSLEPRRRLFDNYTVSQNEQTIRQLQESTMSIPSPQPVATAYSFKPSTMSIPTPQPVTTAYSFKPPAVTPIQKSTQDKRIRTAPPPQRCLFDNYTVPQSEQTTRKLQESTMSMRSSQSVPSKTTFVTPIQKSTKSQRSRTSPQRRLFDHSMVAASEQSIRSTQSAPISYPYKAPVVTPIQWPTQSLRSRSCPHWPRSRCRCDK